MQLTSTDPNDIIQGLGIDFLTSLRMRTGAGEVSFRENYLPLIYQLAKFVQSLPLEKETHSEIGGAFNFAMQSAFLTMRMTGGILFATKLSSERLQKLLPQYHFAAFAASLACVPVLIYKNLDISIDDEPWSYLAKISNLHDAIAASQSKTAFIQWRQPNKSNVNMLSTLVLARFFKHGEFSYFDPIVVAELADAINPTCIPSLAETQFAKIVREGHLNARKSYLDAKALVVQRVESTGAILLQENVSEPEPITSATLPSTEALPTEIELLKESLPEYFTEWINGVMSSEKKEFIKKQENGTMLISVKALSGFGFSAGDLASKFIDDKLATEKNGQTRTVTLHSKLTPLFEDSDA